MINDAQPKSVVTSEEIKQIVTAQLQTFPENFKLSIGGMGEFSKNELISHVNQGDEIGQKIIKIHLEYLRSLKVGILT